MAGVEGVVAHTGGPNRLSVAKLADELWIGVKGQTNLEIAGSPRNYWESKCLV